MLIQEDGDKELKIQGSCLVDAVKLYDSVANLSDKLREFDYLNPFNLLRKTYTHPECYIDFIEKAKEEHSK